MKISCTLVVRFRNSRWLSVVLQIQASFRLVVLRTFSDVREEDLDLPFSFSQFVVEVFLWKEQFVRLSNLAVSQSLQFRLFGWSFLFFAASF